MKPHGVYEYSVDRNCIVKNGFAVGKAALSRNSDNFAVGKSISDTDVKGFKVIIIGIYSVAVIYHNGVAADLLTVCARLAIEEKYGE